MTGLGQPWPNWSFSSNHSAQIYVWIYENRAKDLSPSLTLYKKLHRPFNSIIHRQSVTVLEKPGGLPSRRVGGDSLVVWLPVDTKQGGAALPPGGWGGSLKRAFSSVKRLIFVAGELWPGIDLPVESPNTSRPDTRKVGE